MKKRMAIWVAVLAVCGGLGALAAAYTGGGRMVSVTTVPTVLTGFAADIVSIYNVGTAVVWAQVNVSATTVSNAAAGGTAVPIPANTAYKFDQRDKQQARGVLTTVALVTSNSTATAYVAWY